LTGTCAALVGAITATLGALPVADSRVAQLDALLALGPSDEVSTYGHIALSRLYAARGDHAGALAAIRRRAYMRGWPLYRATSLLEEGRLAEATGDRLGAIHAYSQLLALRPSADTSAAVEMQAIRTRLEQLAASR
jgi:hypothetical protein